MVLESIFNPFSVKKHPWQMFVAGALYSFVSFLLSYVVFREISGLLMVFLVVIAGLPIIYTTIKNEEELVLKFDREITLLKEHTKVLLFLMFFFMGVVFSFVLIYVLFPISVVDSTFIMQQKAIQNVNANVQGGAIEGYLHFGKIFLNNIKVLFFCIIFSLLYGSGALFILTWNASVIAAAMGSVIREQLLSSTGTFFGAATFGFFRYMTHGVFEILAYFVAGLAGGIISIALIKHNFGNKKVLIDALDLILISIGLLVFAGIVEVYITPLLFI